MRVFVLLFNARTENEGIHTIRIGDRNKVLMFESEDDATRFSLMLEAQDFPSPTVESIEDEEVKEFCQQADLDWELVTEGMLAVPPDSNAEQLDWQPEEAAKDSKASVDASEEDSSSMSDTELERIRRRLEGLL
ncbi:MAG: DUF3110 domain-containing protein [Desertifilum sp. SIO1I2]|nr:DUF3110 domain-containing protein [Desertifilum sp. SIO1I2]